MKLTEQKQKELRELAEKFGEQWDCFSKPMAVNNKITGLGDVVAAVTKAVGIKPCSGCRKRQSWLNKLIPFGQNT